MMKVNGKDIKRVQCLLCTQQLADGGGTSNLMSHLQAKHLEEYKRCTNDSSKSCKTQSTLHSFSWVCPPERATAITKRIAEFVAFLYENLVGVAVLILQLSVRFIFRISGCRKPTSVAALLTMIQTVTMKIHIPLP